MVYAESSNTACHTIVSTHPVENENTQHTLSFRAQRHPVVDCVYSVTVEAGNGAGNVNSSESVTLRKCSVACLCKINDIYNNKYY